MTRAARGARRARSTSAASRAVDAASLDGRGRLDHVADRPERRRQDDALQHRRRVRAPRAAGRVRSTASGSTAGRRTRSRGAGSCGRSRRPSADAHDRAREHARSRRPGASGRALLALVGDAARRSGGASASSSERALGAARGSSASTALADDYAGTLSGGQRKLLEFTRALMTEPRMLLLDEPMAGVNPTLARSSSTASRALRDEDRPHLPAHRARPRDGHVRQRPGDRHERGTRDRDRHAGRGTRGSGVIDAYLGTHGPGRAVSTGAPVLTALDLSPATASSTILHGVSVVVPAGRVRLGDRAERRRQVHAAEGDLRARRPPRREASASTSTETTSSSPRLAPHELTRLGLNYVPQLDNVFPNMSVAGEPRDRRGARPEAAGARLERDLRRVPGARAAPPAARRHALGRRAARCSRSRGR